MPRSAFPILRTEGCHEGQGYLFSRARPNTETVALLKAQRGCEFVAPQDPPEETALVA